MIRNENEYQEAVRRLTEEKKRLEEHRAHLKTIGLDKDELKRALDPLRSFQAQLEEEVVAYERMKRGEVDPLLNLHGLGRRLVALRIARGLTQRELAERLSVHESQVSRDERNDYHGITVERATKVLEALSVRMSSSFDLLTRDSSARVNG
jgi:DNA-directed RNA polymerase specialized sigma subunit